jgi:hypothetical protein
VKGIFPFHQNLLDQFHLCDPSLTKVMLCNKWLQWDSPNTRYSIFNFLKNLHTVFHKAIPI